MKLCDDPLTLMLMVGRACRVRLELRADLIQKLLQPIARLLRPRRHAAMRVVHIGNRSRYLFTYSRIAASFGQTEVSSAQFFAQTLSRPRSPAPSTRLEPHTLQSGGIGWVCVVFCCAHCVGGCSGGVDGGDGKETPAMAGQAGGEEGNKSEAKIGYRTGLHAARKTRFGVDPPLNSEKRVPLSWLALALRHTACTARRASGGGSNHLGTYYYCTTPLRPC